MKISPGSHRLAEAVGLTHCFDSDPKELGADSGFPVSSPVSSSCAGDAIGSNGLGSPLPPSNVFLTCGCSGNCGWVLCERVRPKSKTVKRVHAISKTVQKKALGTQKKVKSREDQKRRLAELDKIVEEMILDDVPLQKHRIGEKLDVLRNHRIGEIVDERRSYVLRKHRIGQILDDVPLQLKRVPRNKKWPRKSLTVMSSSLTRDAICASAPKVERPGSFDKSLKAAPRRIIELDLSRESIDLD